MPATLNQSLDSRIYTRRWCGRSRAPNQSRGMFHYAKFFSTGCADGNMRVEQRHLFFCKCKIIHDCKIQTHDSANLGAALIDCGQRGEGREIPVIHTHRSCFSTPSSLKRSYTSINIPFAP